MGNVRMRLRSIAADSGWRLAVAVPPDTDEHNAHGYECQRPEHQDKPGDYAEKDEDSRQESPNRSRYRTDEGPERNDGRADNIPECHECGGQRIADAVPDGGLNDNAGTGAKQAEDPSILELGFGQPEIFEFALHGALRAVNSACGSA